MKLSMVISALIVAILVVLLLKPWTRDGQPNTPGNAEARPGFMKACTPVAGAMPRPEAYCACLWDHGVTSPAQTLTRPAAQAAAAQCASRAATPRPQVPTP